MKFVIKLGQASLENRALLDRAMRAVADLVQDGNQVAVVHDGDSHLIHVLKALGIEVKFVNGLRATNKEVRDVSLMVLAGLVNKRLVAALGALGQPAVGVSGGDGLMFRARKKGTTADVGFMGEIVTSDPRWIQAIWQCKGVPVVSSIALGFDGEYYNVDADEMAAACALACNADVLVFLTNVPGVKGAAGEVLRWLSIDQIAEMAQNQVISGDMLPKLGTCREALLKGVKRVRLLPAEACGSLPDLCSARIIHGTELVAA